MCVRVEGYSNKRAERERGGVRVIQVYAEVYEDANTEDRGNRTDA